MNELNFFYVQNGEIVIKREAFGMSRGALRDEESECLFYDELCSIINREVFQEVIWNYRTTVNIADAINSRIKFRKYLSPSRKQVSDDAWAQVAVKLEEAHDLLVNQLKPVYEAYDCAQGEFTFEDVASVSVPKDLKSMVVFEVDSEPQYEMSCTVWAYPMDTPNKAFISINAKGCEVVDLPMEDMDDLTFIIQISDGYKSMTIGNSVINPLKDNIERAYPLDGGQNEFILADPFVSRYIAKKLFLRVGDRSTVFTREMMDVMIRDSELEYETEAHRKTPCEFKGCRCSTSGPITNELFKIREVLWYTEVRSNCSRMWAKTRLPGSVLLPDPKLFARAIGDKTFPTEMTNVVNFRLNL